MKKIYTIIIALIALCGGFYALVRFAGLNPDELFQKPAAKTEFYGTVDPERLQQLYDSLESINFAIRKETDERLLKNLKDTQKNLWERILSARNAISKAEAPKTIKEEESNLMDHLIKGIAITAAVLLTIIIFLIIKIMRRHKEVEKVTERLKNLQTEPLPPPPLSGLDPTVFQTRFSGLPLPKVKPAETVAVRAVEPPPPPMRKTAKQRVTEAVEKLRQALTSVRSGTMKSPIATDSLTKTKIRVTSLNSTKINPPADETTYDRKVREKKQVLDWARQGRTPAEISKWAGLPRDQVETIIRLARERGE
ncbi:MAG: helix-turn-helix domain containing protein [Fibromonadaceae bacterium]|nr:helix-turn-helix domain containing protein [Fibromonadaceae bacterium]